jgi:hypothetical protein
VRAADRDECHGPFLPKRDYEDEAQCDSILSPSPLLKHYPGHLWCLLSWEAQHTTIEINSSDSDAGHRYRGQSRVSYWQEQGAFEGSDLTRGPYVADAMIDAHTCPIFMFSTTRVAFGACPVISRRHPEQLGSCDLRHNVVNVIGSSQRKGQQW